MKIISKITLVMTAVAGIVFVLLGISFMGMSGHMSSVIAQKNASVEYTVTFDSQGGTEVPSQIVLTGKKATAPTSPVRELDFNYQYSFDNWYKEAECTNVFNFMSETITEDITLYAKWTLTPIPAGHYVVMYETNGGTHYEPFIVEANYYLTDNDLMAPSKASDSEYDYAFAGWYSDAAFTHEFDQNADNIISNTTIYAKWTATPTSATDSGEEESSSNVIITPDKEELPNFTNNGIVSMLIVGIVLFVYGLACAIISIIAFKKLEVAKTKKDIKTYGILACIFSFVAPGVFLLKLTDADIREKEEIETRR